MVELGFLQCCKVYLHKCEIVSLFLRQSRWSTFAWKYFDTAGLLLPRKEVSMGDQALSFEIVKELL